MSAEPLPSKSPTPAIVHDSGTGPKSVDCATAVPFIFQIPTSPVTVLRQNMSPWLSAPAIIQVVGTLPTIADCWTVVPFISQMPTLPDVSRQTMSALPSPLKSPVAATDQLVGTLP